MLLGILLGLLLLGLIAMYVMDDDRELAVLFILSVFSLMVASVMIGYGSHTQYEVKQQVKPSIKVVTENGKSDTTYTYKFEDKK